MPSIFHNFGKLSTEISIAARTGFREIIIPWKAAPILVGRSSKSPCPHWPGIVYLSIRAAPIARNTVSHQLARCTFASPPNPIGWFFFFKNGPRLDPPSCSSDFSNRYKIQLEINKFRTSLARLKRKNRRFYRTKFLLRQSYTMVHKHVRVRVFTLLSNPCLSISSLPVPLCHYRLPGASLIGPRAWRNAYEKGSALFSGWIVRLRRFAKRLPFFIRVETYFSREKESSRMQIWKEKITWIVFCLALVNYLFSLKILVWIVRVVSNSR